MQDSANPESAQVPRTFPRVSAAPILELLDLDEVRRRYGVAHSRVYRAVLAGELHRYGRPGRQAYYLADEVERVFGLAGQNGGGDPAKATKTRRFTIAEQLRLVA